VRILLVGISPAVTPRSPQLVLECLIFMLKAEASVLIRLEIAKGKSDNEALYLRFGHSF
jgi:hypothetical protein